METRVHGTDEPVEEIGLVLCLFRCTGACNPCDITRLLDLECVIEEHNCEPNDKIWVRAHKAIHQR